MRQRWDPEFPRVFVHTHYCAADDEDLSPGISDSPLWTPAKKARNVKSAIELIDRIADDEVLERLYDATFDDAKESKPLVIAPAAIPSESNNALAISYAEWLAAEMNWDVAQGIFQKKDFSKDKSAFWDRMAHSSEFYGQVQKGRNYVIVDDILTLGGTIADLRGYLIHNGGRVIAASALAHRSGSDVQIALDKTTEFGLQSIHGHRFDEFCVQELGYETSCLTEPEASRILRIASIDEIRNGIDGARNG